MSKLNELFGKKLSVVNFGIESFYQDLLKQSKPAVHVDWKPVAGGDKKIAGYLRKLRQPPLGERIAAANQERLTAFWRLSRYWWVCLPPARPSRA